MQLVKVGEQFYQECKKHGTDKELLFNKSGRPCVLIVKLKYKGQNHKFVVPLRSNISANTPRNQYFALPPNSATKSGNRHGVHYIKLFPIDSLCFGISKRTVLYKSICIEDWARQKQCKVFSLFTDICKKNDSRKDLGNEYIR